MLRKKIWMQNAFLLQESQEEASGFVSGLSEQKSCQWLPGFGGGRREMTTEVICG